jgi:hypothetical protein
MLQGLASVISRKDRSAACVRWLSAIAALFLSTAPAKASSTLFYNTTPGANICQASTGGCLQAGVFGLLTGWDHPGAGYYTGTLSDTGYNQILGTGNGGSVGIGTGSTITTSGASAQTWTGPIDFADSGSTGLPNNSVLSNVTITNSTALSVSAVDTALNQILSIANYYSTYSTQTVLSSLGGSNTTLTVSGVKVYSVSSINITHVLTIVGTSSDIIVFNSSSAIFGAGTGSHIGNIVLSGGITPDQVLFNLTGTGADLSISGGASIFADFIVRGSYNVSNATVTGRILGGTGTDTLGGSFVLNDPADATAPEPGEWALMTGGLGALFYLSRRRSGRKRPDPGGSCGPDPTPQQQPVAIPPPRAG